MEDELGTCDHHRLGKEPHPKGEACMGTWKPLESARQPAHCHDHECGLANPHLDCVCAICGETFRKHPKAEPARQPEKGKPVSVVYHGPGCRCTSCKLKEAEAELEKLRKALRVIAEALKEPAGGSYWPARAYLDRCGAYHDDLDGDRVLLRVAEAALSGKDSTPAKGANNEW